MRITREEILLRTNGGLDIFQFVFDIRNTGVNLKQGKMSSLKNPFYKDTKGSLSIFKNQSGEYHFRDFGDESFKGDCFSFFASHLGLDTSSDFKEICDVICCEILEEDSAIQKEIKHKSAVECDYQIGDDFRYWAELFPAVKSLREMADKFGLVSLIQLQQGNNLIKASYSNPIYGFRLGGAMKTYRPFEKVYKHSWLKKDEMSLFHFLNLIDPSKPVLITEGYKDAFSAFTNNFNVFPLDNASSDIPSVALEFFRKHGLSLLLCLDNDPSGQKGMEKLSDAYGIPFHLLCFENEPKGKDVTDFLAATGGKSKLESILKSEALPLLENQLLCKLYKQQKMIMEKSKGQINWTEPLITLDDNSLIYAQTINVIQGHAGTHKSRNCESIAAAALSIDGSSIAGFKRNEKCKPMRVLYVDTERNQRDQLPYAIQQIRKLAGFDPFEEIPSLNVISLIPFSRKERGELIGQYLEKEIEQTEGELLVILDVLTDCVTDFNSVGDSLNLIDLMNTMINEYKVTFVTVIHSNPNSDKARGHLGTELMNKSSSVLSLKEEGAHFQVDVKKLRQSKRFGPVFLSFNEENKHLELSNRRPESKSENPKKKLEDANRASMLLGKYKQYEAISTKTLVQSFMSLLGCKDRKAEICMNTIIKEQVVIDSYNTPCYLIRVKRGYVTLKPVGSAAQTQITL